MLYIAEILALHYTSVFNFDDVHSLEGALTNLLPVVFFQIVVRRRFWSVERAQQTCMREGKKDIYNALTKVWIVLLSAVLVRNLHSFVQTLRAKNKLINEIDIKCITRGVTKSRMLDGKADGCS